LPDRFRAAVVLCYLEGLTHEMAAQQSGCPVGTIRSRLATARAQLRQRLTRRGIGPAAVPTGLSGTAMVSVSEPAAFSMSVPAALVDTTVRGALRVGLGKGALAAIVSAETVTLMEGLLKTMMTTKLMLLTATVLVAGLVTTGAGVAAYSALGRDDGLARGRSGEPSPAQTIPQKPEPSPPVSQVQKEVAQPTPTPPNSDVAKAKMKEITDRVQSLVREYASDHEAYRRASRNAKNAEEERALAQTHRGANPAFYAGALLDIADRYPRTPAAEEALIWIVENLGAGSMVERAKEIVVRDHIRSDKLVPLFNNWQVHQVGSLATERMFREALAQNPHRKIQGLACYYLARFLDYQAFIVSAYDRADEAHLRTLASSIQGESWGLDYVDRLRKLNPEALLHQAASLYERVVKEFADVPVEDPDHRFWEPTLGAAAQMSLHELKDLSVGHPAPEIVGVDLDGKPMKLSEYRGKVVALYFAPVSFWDRPAVAAVREVALRHASDSFVLLGVATFADRETFKKALAASGVSARIWFDSNQEEKPGPIEMAWNHPSPLDVYVLDHRGVIRYKRVRPRFLENAVSTLLKEQRDELGRSKKND